jgi:hypothetical protein
MDDQIKRKNRTGWLLFAAGIGMILVCGPVAGFSGDKTASIVGESLGLMALVVMAAYLVMPKNKTPTVRADNNFRAGVVCLSVCAFVLLGEIATRPNGGSLAAQSDHYVGETFKVSRVTDYVGPDSSYEYNPGENIKAKLLIYVPGPGGHFWGEEIRCLFPPDTPRFASRPIARPEVFGDRYIWITDRIRVLGAAGANSQYYCESPP